MTHFNRFKTSYLFYALLGVICYSMFCGVTGMTFSMLVALSIFNLFTIFNAIKAPPETTVSEPIEFVQFVNNEIRFGETTINIHKIRKVALEKVKQDCYFSLPYNPSKPGEVPGFVFPAGQMQRFEQHLRSGLENIEIIR